MRAVETRISSRVKRLCVCGALLAVSMMLSYVELLISVTLMPLPGFKLGLANIVVVFVIFAIGSREAFVISAARVTLSSVLFGSVSSFIFSLCGALLSFAVLYLCKRVFAEKLSLFGISVLSAAAHNTGQMIAACFVMKTAYVYTYLPYLLLLSIPCGLITGLVAALIFKRKDIMRISE